MIPYAIIMFVMAVLFVWIGCAVRKGNTKLIMEQHQTRVSEEKKSSYGKSFSTGLFVMGAGALLSGIIGLLDESDRTVLISAGVLIAGLIAGVVMIGRTQKKFNGGVF